MINGTIIAVVVERVTDDTNIASKEANNVPTYPPDTINKYACKKYNGLIN